MSHVPTFVYFQEKFHICDIEDANYVAQDLHKPVLSK